MNISALPRTFYHYSGLRKLRWTVAQYAQYFYHRQIPPHWHSIHLLIAKWNFRGFRYPCTNINIDNLVIKANWNSLNRGRDDELLIKEWMKKVRKNTMVSYDGLYTTAQLVKYCENNNIPGDYLETGTWKGGALAVMGQAWMHWKNPQCSRRLLGFDSFCGIPEPNPKNDDTDWIRNQMHLHPESIRGDLKPVGALEASQNDVKDLFQKINFPQDKLHIYEGWFQDTIPNAIKDIQSLAILRLDGDLYESTRYVLEHLSELVSPGGFIIIDDWCLSGARQATEQYLLRRFGKTPPVVNRIDGDGAYFQIPFKSPESQ